MKLSFRLIGKIGFLLVVLGFFMPIACDKNGLEIAKSLSNNGDKITLSVICFCLFFVAALAGCVIGLSLLMKKKKRIKVSYDWICLIVCIGSGLIVYITEYAERSSVVKNALEPQAGAYFILAGLIVALAAQVLAKIGREA